MHRDIHSISQLHFRALAKVCVTSPLSQIISLVCTSHLNHCIPTRQLWRTLRFKGYQRDANRAAFAHTRARDKKDVILAYLNVLISQARISGCTKGRGRPFGSSRGGGSHSAWSMGEFSLWLRERAATMVIYLMRKLGRGERRRGNGRVKERARIVFARARVRESVSKNNGLQHPPPATA